jgi:hypothetical protein
VGRVSLGVAIVCVATAWTPASAQAAAAEEGVADERPERPVQWVSTELNPLAMLSGLFGGQLQVGVAGPVTLQAGLSYFGLGQTVHCAGTDGCRTTPGAHGMVLEVGPRVFLPLNQADRTRVYAWIGPAFGHNWINVHDGTPTRPAYSFEKNRVILDVGAHVPLGSSPLYLLVGAGYSKALDSNGAGKLDHQSPSLASSLLDWTYPSQYVGNGTSIRILFAIGAGF